MFTRTKKLNIVYSSCVVFAIITLLIGESSQHVMGFSPDFVQHMEDESFDLSAFDVPYGDIRIVKYQSNGKLLNATLWLHDPPVTRNGLQSGVEELRYGVLIDADFSSNTGVDGADYEFYIEMTTRNDEPTWKSYLVEHTSPSLSRTIYSAPVNYTQVLEDDNEFVFLMLDLEKIGFPNDYRIISYASTIKDLIRRVDFTSWLDVPLTNFFVIVSPEQLEGRRGESKEASIEIGSNTNSISSITGVEALENPPNIRLILPSEDHQDYRYPTPVKVEIPDRAPLGEHRVPLLANISLSQPTFPHIFKDVDLNYTQSNITSNLNFNATVLARLTPAEWWDEFWKSYGGIIQLLSAGFIGGLSSHTVNYFTQRRLRRGT